MSAYLLIVLQHGTALAEAEKRGKLPPPAVLSALVAQAMAAAAAAKRSNFIVTDFPYTLDQAFDFEAKVGLTRP